MRKATTTQDLRKLARYFLEHPDKNTADATRDLKFASGFVARLLCKTGAEAFLQSWGGDAATPAAVAESLAHGLRNSGVRERNRTKSRNPEPTQAPIPAAPSFLFWLERSLGAHECQWLVNPIGPQFYCGLPVEGPYCADHSRIAKREEEERFLIARNLVSR